ncbi:CsgG/HfaB family protein [Pontiella agarivorans]|uniref:CsgG/HfaB family protein n=1 Tax=Pontiella agarivorans TaxID=3038953 RepID=A0ABU5MW91_9BACT|nr:CsgG/HfaB family protein [Pontiella agarivorans]MDZ8118480.1 CsgG/HfaB family protein [Pontiella agarivorans]
MMNKKLRSSVSCVGFILIAGCATVDKQPQAVEAPVSREAQLQAQKQQALPPKPRLKRKIAIGRFSNETRYGRSLLRDDENDPLGKQVSDILAGRLVESDRFLVFERPDINKLKTESELTGQTLNLVGVDTMIFGSLTEFGMNTTGKKGFLSSTKKQTAEASVELRLVDVKTGRIFFTAKGSGSASVESGEIAGYGSKASYDATLSDKAIDAAVSDVLNTLIRKLEEKTWKTSILTIENGQVYISGGAHQGISKGDTFAVMKRGKTVKSPQTGLDIELPASNVASIEILSLFGEDEAGEGSIARVTAGDLSAYDINDLFITEQENES